MDQEILLTRQHHKAERAGDHYDFRIVIGDKAYSWATRKELPQPGKSIILHEQPVHTSHYALSKKVVIPKGQYGAGVTTLDWVKKGKARIKPDEYLLHLTDGSRFLIKHMPSYGEKQWLFFNITGIGADKPIQKKANAQEAAVANQEHKHQNRVIEKLKKDHPRLIAFHGLGSGKTKTGLMAAKDAQKEQDQHVLMITPASLTKNVEKEMKKHKISLDKKRFKTISYEKAVRNIEELMQKKHGLIVLDEAHKLREEETQRVKELKPLLARSKKLLLLSGSPIYNKPTDLSNLVNIAANKQILPSDPKEFEQQYIHKEKINPGLMKRIFLRVKPGTREELKNQKKLKAVLDDYVDYYKPDEKAKAFYPKETEEEVKVPMSSKQEQLYKFFEGRLPPHIKWKIRMGLPPDKKESAQLNAFASALRQVANSHGPFKQGDLPDDSISPKVETAVSRLIAKMEKDKNFRGLVYSNYLPAGLHPYSAALHRAGIKHEIFSGDLTAKEKNKLVEKYNKGQLPVLLVSSSGGEGLDLKGTKLVQILEPHWNKKKIDQVRGRAARYMSHMHLPKEERNVHTEHYISTIKPTITDRIFKIKPKSIDEYLRDRSNDKENISKQIEGLLQSDK